MLLSAVSVLVVAQSSSEIPEGLMNTSVQSMGSECEKLAECVLCCLYSPGPNTFTWRRRRRRRHSHRYYNTYREAVYTADSSEWQGVSSMCLLGRYCFGLLGCVLNKCGDTYCLQVQSVWIGWSYTDKWNTNVRYSVRYARPQRRDI